MSIGRGISRAITLLRDEVDRNMAMLGVRTLDQVDRSVII
nr:alpha-hydroxy-acid oxidizing protein [uncultured Cupriavidus sp.]